MYAHAIHDWHEGGDLRDLLHAMTSGGPGRHRHHGHGPGRGGLAGGGGRHWRGRRARRGDIRSAALLLLAEEPRNGYQIMQEVQERSGGLWSPSPGSVYPALAQLEDEGLVRAQEIDGRRLFELTEAGRAHVQERDPGRPAPWDAVGGEAAGPAQELAHGLKAAVIAATQVLRIGDSTQMTEAQRILDTARRELYRVLAGLEDAAGEEDTPTARTRGRARTRRAAPGTPDD